MTTKNTHIFDKVFKKILTLSTKAVINLINGLFGTDYPEDSTITYNWTEFMDTELRRTLADTIITINNRYSYHIEAQLEKDEDIVFRVFEYGFHHADHRRASTEEYHVLHFPEPKIIYLYSTKDIPNTYTLRLDFGGQGYFDYKVPVFKYLETSLEELIETNYQSGNISINDAYKLQRLTKQLYNYIYAHYAEMEELNDMTDESLLLDIDILEMKYEKKLAEKLQALEALNRALAEKDSALAEKDSEIQRLKAELQRLQQR